MLTAARHHRAAAGFTIIEMMVAIAILGALFVIGGPALSTFIANSRVKTSAESFAMGLQAARAEAVRQNRPVQFVLTADTAPTAAKVDTITASDTGTSWMVRYSQDPGTPATAPFVFVESKSSLEGSGSGSASSPIVVSSTVPTIQFGPLGDTTLGANATITLVHGDASQCSTNVAGTGGSVRCLNVRVSVGGRVQVCDPLVGTTDTRSC